MTLFEFAWKNISRDRRNYIFYFVNCVFSVFVFFLFSILSFHPALNIIDPHSTMGMTLIVGEAVSVVFSIFFISYSMRCFLKNRSRQLGLYGKYVGGSYVDHHRYFVWNGVFQVFS